MAKYTPQTSERAIQAMLNAGKLTAAQLEQEAIKDLGWAEKLAYCIKESWIDENQLTGLFAKSVSLTRSFPAPEEIHDKAVGALPYRYLTEYSLLPYQVEDQFLKVLIIDPRVAQMKADLKTNTQYEILFEITSLSHMDSLLQSERITRLLAQSTASKPPAPAPEKAAEVKKPEEKKVVYASGGQRAWKEKWNVNEPDLVIEFCNQILRQAIEEKASDIHIECFRTYANVRLRQDGEMRVVGFYSPYLFKNYAAVTTRFKILADCDISERRLPQDGAITVKDAQGHEIDFRFNVMPTKNGERIVMRILAGDPALSLDKIGFDPQDYQKVIEAITAPQGMVLVTGPTGSGKTTTLYGALQYINRPNINILTAEDPVEYYLDGAGQVQANERIGLSFSAILRGFLRQDPEVILVGEIRDQETIDIAIKAALTGHLLLSTLHTNDAIATITRILNMGVPNFMISSALSLVIAQRLARKNCSACAQVDARATPEVLQKLGFKGDLSGVVAKKGVGCKQCGGRGQRGRRGIYEVLRITKAMEEAILRNEQAPGLLAAARQDGFRTMQEIGRELIMAGEISIEEYQSTLSADSD